MPNKSSQAFRTIREVADWLGVEAHVLRFWESKFTQIKPVKRAGGRRYYRPADMQLIGGIKVLLHEQGLTIRGVQKMLREDGVPHVAGLSPSLDAAPAEPVMPAPAAVEATPQPVEIEDAEIVETIAAEPDTATLSQDETPVLTPVELQDIPAAEFAPMTAIRDLLSQSSSFSEEQATALAPLLDRLQALAKRLGSKGQTSAH